MKSASIGSYIRSLRTENNLTQQGLAERLHVTDKAVSKWERGLSLPDVLLFPKLAEELGVTVADLLQQCTDEGTPSRLVRYYRETADVRTPLHIILGCADLMEKHLDNPALVRRYLESIHISGQYLLSVFDRVRDHPDLQELLRSGSPSREKTPSPYDFSGRRILVVDDIELNREIAGEILKDAGAEVDFAEDGQVCVDLVFGSPQGRYDLILMDIKMPVLDGLEATRRLRAAGVSVPVVAMTANVRPNDRKAALEAGMDAFTEKPVRIAQLFSAMDACLKKAGKNAP